MSGGFGGPMSRFKTISAHIPGRTPFMSRTLAVQTPPDSRLVVSNTRVTFAVHE